jgi:RES domain-containing protein
MKVWRLAKASCAAPDGEGARKYGGRWNPHGLAVIYTSESLSLAALEALVHAESDLLPDDFVILSADIPDRLSLQTIGPEDLPNNWQAIPAIAPLQVIGADWIRTNQTVGLRVPSAVIPQEWNVLLNPAYPKFSTIKWTSEGPFRWDSRLVRSKK